MLDAICARPTPFGQAHDKFRSDVFTWHLVDEVRDFVLFGPSAHIARQAFGSNKINFFYDQIFVKQELTPDPTPWHHDKTFWPIDGEQIASLWTSVDPVTAETSALEFIAGSHLWPNRYKAVGAGGIVMSSEPLDELPDIEADRDAYNILSWDLKPGDALLFHALTLHGARGNRSPNQKRRAITTRWCGDDVVFRPSGRQMPIPWEHGLEPGEPLSGPVFPEVLPQIDQVSLAPRMQGPIFPAPHLIAEIGQHIAAAERVPVKLEVF